MANKYPYVPSAGPWVKTVNHLRRSFPREVTADTLRKLGVAPKNESYVINVLRFLGIIDDEGKDEGKKVKLRPSPLSSIKTKHSQRNLGSL